MSDYKLSFRGWLFTQAVAFLAWFFGYRLDEVKVSNWTQNPARDNSAD